MEEYKIESASILGNINNHMETLKKYDYKEKTGTIYLSHLHEIFELQKEIGYWIIIDNNKILIYDGCIE